MSEQFQNFFSQLLETNATLDYFTDFKKVRKNITPIAIKLHQLNYLIGKSNLEEAINDLYEANPTVFDALGILIAVRETKKVKTKNNQGEIVCLDNYLKSVGKIIEFVQETGLSQLFQNKEVTNLVDYVFGIEVGLDTNARKNRGGNNMSVAVASIFKNEQIAFQPEVPSTSFSEIKSLGVDVKVFDFVIKTLEKTYLIEANFYNSGGSKLNEVARAYTDVAPKINQYSKYEFVWITDGQGWKTAKNKLEEAFNMIPSVYNLTSLGSFIEKIKAEGVVTESGN